MAANIRGAESLVREMRHGWVRSGGAPNAPATHQQALFLPRYNFDGLQKAQQELAKFSDGIPAGDDLSPLLQKLNTHIQTQQSNLLGGVGFDQTAWNAQCDVIKKAIEKSQSDNDSVNNVKACNKALDNLKALQEDALAQEMEAFNRSLQRQLNQANMERVYATMQEMYGKANAENMLWEKLTGYNEDELEKDVNTLLDPTSEPDFLIKKADSKLANQPDGYGVYHAPGSSFNISFFAEEGGMCSCNATMIEEPTSELRKGLSLLVDVLDTWSLAIPRVPIQIALYSLCELTGYVNKETGQPKIPWPMTAGTYLFGNPKNSSFRDKVKEQMNFLQAKAGAKEFFVDYSTNEVDKFQIQNIIIALQEAKKRGGYDPKGTPKFKNPNAAMLFNLTSRLEKALANTSSNDLVTTETRQYMRLFGYKGKDVKQFIFRQIRDFNQALKPEQEAVNIKANDANFKNAFKQAIETPQTKKTPTFDAPADSVPGKPAATVADLAPSAPPEEPASPDSRATTEPNTPASHSRRSSISDSDNDALVRMRAGIADDEVPEPVKDESDSPALDEDKSELDDKSESVSDLESHSEDEPLANMKGSDDYSVDDAVNDEIKDEEKDEIKLDDIHSEISDDSEADIHATLNAAEAENSDHEVDEVEESKMHYDEDEENENVLDAGDEPDMMPKLESEVLAQQEAEAKEAERIAKIDAQIEALKNSPDIEEAPKADIPADGIPLMPTLAKPEEEVKPAPIAPTIPTLNLSDVKPENDLNAPRAAPVVPSLDLNKVANKNDEVQRNRGKPDLKIDLSGVKNRRDQSDKMDAAERRLDALQQQFINRPDRSASEHSKEIHQMQDEHGQLPMTPSLVKPEPTATTPTKSTSSLDSLANAAVEFAKMMEEKRGAKKENQDGFNQLPGHDDNAPTTPRKK